MLILIIGMGFTTCYLAFARFWLERSAYETSICLSTQAPKTHCEMQLIESIARVLTIGSLDQRILRREKDRVITSITWSLSQKMNFKIHFSDQRKLPLIERKIR